MTAPASDIIPDLAEFTARWEDWHGRHEAGLAGPHGFLAITSLHWLDGEPRRFPDAPGRWSTGPNGVGVTLAEGEELVIGGKPVPTPSPGEPGRSRAGRSRPAAVGQVVAAPVAVVDQVAEQVGMRHDEEAVQALER